jgi:hypothetical protein
MPTNIYRASNPSGFMISNIAYNIQYIPRYVIEVDPPYNGSIYPIGD